jgi:2-methylcitrate dehydratase PrpD
LAHKPFPAGRATHGAIEGVLTLRDRHGFTADDVAEIVATVPPLTAQLISRPDLPDPLPNYARLCTGFVVAKVLQFGALDLSHYRGEALRDPRTHELAARVRVESDTNSDPNALVPQDVVVRLRDGRVLKWHCDSMLASEQRPLTRNQHLAKFRRCCTFAERPWDNDRIQKTIDAVDRLEAMADVRELISLLG